MDFTNIFWEKVDMSKGPDECWPWTKGISLSTGYGAMKVNGKRIDSHRYALSLKLGRPVRRGFLACHTCNNRICCNPKHLYEGTHKSNVEDAIRAGRLYTFTPLSGESSLQAILSESDVLVIVERLNTGEIQRVIAKDFGVSRSTIAGIKRGKTWNLITGLRKLDK